MAKHPLSPPKQLRQQLRHLPDPVGRVLRRRHRWAQLRPGIQRLRPGVLLGDAVASRRLQDRRSAFPDVRRRLLRGDCERGVAVVATAAMEPKGGGGVAVVHTLALFLSPTHTRVVRCCIGISRYVSGNHERLF